MSRTTAGGTRPSIGRPLAQAVPQVGRGDVEARDRPRAATRHPAPGRLGRATSPARSTTTTVARSRVSSSRRQVPMLATASAPSTRNSSRPGAASASSVSAVTDARVALDLDRARPRRRRRRRPRRSTSARRSARRRHHLAPLLPRVPGDHEQHPVEAELRARPRWRRPRGRRARDRTCPRTRPQPLHRPSSARESTGGTRVFTSAKHSRHQVARSIDPVSDASEPATHVLVRVWLPDRPGALGLVASRIGAVDGDIVGIDVLERGDNVAVDEFAVLLRDVDRARPARARDRGGRRRQRRGGAHDRPLPRPAPRRARVGDDAVRGRQRRRRCTRTLVEQTRAEFLADWSALLLDGVGARRRRATSATTRRCSRRWSPAPRRRRWSPTAPPGPTTSRSRRCPTHDAALLVGRDGHAFRRRERAQLVALGGHRRPHLGAARLNRRRSPLSVPDRVPLASARSSSSRATCASTTTPRSRAAVATPTPSCRCSCSTTRSSRSAFNRPNRTGFLLESLADLDAALRSLGGRLVVRRGDWVDEVAARRRATSAPTPSTSATT